jgi:hypothetical protein
MTMRIGSAVEPETIRSMEKPATIHCMEAMETT